MLRRGAEHDTAGDDASRWGRVRSCRASRESWSCIIETEKAGTCLGRAGRPGSSMPRPSENTTAPIQSTPAAKETASAAFAEQACVTGADLDRSGCQGRDPQLGV